MPLVVGVKFKDSGKIYHFDPNQHHLELGDAVVVETVRGLELGKVAAPIEDLPDSDLIAELKPVIRQPTTEDYDRMRVLAERRDDVLRICAERISVHRLPMRLIRSDWNFDGTRLTIYFTSQQRVDFRHLVRELARIFHARIELRQIGARDEAKLLGGLGPCGRPLCCSTFLPDFARVSVKMAKDQDLPLNPSKISGVCGRLLCCLSYEQEQYLEIKAELPTRGEQVKTPEGIGYVVAVNTIRETVTVDVESNYLDFKADQLETITSAAGAIARERLEQGEAAPIAQKRFNRPVGETLKSSLNNNWDNEDWGLDELRSFDDEPNGSSDKPKPRPKQVQQSRPHSAEPREPRANPNEPRPRFDRAERQKRFNRSENPNPEPNPAPSAPHEQSERKPRHAFKRKGDTTPTPERPKLPATVRQQSLGGVPEQLTPRGRQPSTNDPDEPKQPMRRRRRGNSGNNSNQQQGQQQAPKPKAQPAAQPERAAPEKPTSEAAKSENTERRSPRRRKRRG
ncbi:regulatory iron-sulfur-containing complex subunit RicT [Herpetosiphon llansteffanensis]